jgi:SAM-dependent methyltransferase
MPLFASLHRTAVFDRRVRVLAESIAALLPQGARLLDVGCGDGTIDQLIMTLRPDVTIEGIDVMIRPETKIPVQKYDGAHFPYADGSFDYIMLIDVLHHTDDAVPVLAEARRVAKKGIIVKDHLRDGFLAGPTLRFMDWVGNAPHGVVLVYRYFSDAQWEEVFKKLGLRRAKWIEKLALYPAPFSYVFGRRLHFLAVLE